MSNTETKSYTVKNDVLGEIKIADDVVAVIAGLAASDVEGVEGTAASMTGELAKKMGFKMPSQGIKATIIEGDVEVEIALVLKYGFNVMDVSSKVQEKVKNSIQNMTGFNVVSVNVKVAGVAVE